MRIIIGKCFFSSIVAFLFFIPSIRTQSIILERPYWHFLVGGNYTSVGRGADDGDPRVGFDNEPRVGPILGLGYRHTFAKGHGEFRLTYLSQKGSFRTAAGGRFFGASNKFDLVTDWLNMSYLLSYQNDAPVALRFEFGPNLSFLLNAGDEVEIQVRQWSFQSQARNRSFQLTEHNGSLLKSSMLGLQTGLALIYPINDSFSGSASISYQFGVNTRQSGFFIGESIRFHVFMLAIGVQSLIE